MTKQILILLTSILVISCQTNEKKSVEKEKINLNGNWEYLGFGKAIVIGDSIVQSYHTSTVGNVQTSDNPSTDFFNYYTVDTLSNDTILLKDGVKTFKLFRSTKDFGKMLKDQLANDPKYNFEVLWNTFNEQYVYFKERNVDWNKMYEKYEPQINSETKPLELYLIFERMLREINDSHVSIELPESLEKEYNSIEGKVSPKNTDVTGEFKKEVRNKIVQRYLKDPKKFNKGSITYGKISDHIGYLAIQNMVTMAYYSDIPDSLSTDDFNNRLINTTFSQKNEHDEVRKGTRFMMDSIINYLGSVKAFIIDLRFNGGGFDDASVEILNHFVSEKIDFATKKVRLGDGFTEKQIMSLYPSKKTFTGKVYVLTSKQTASAAEVLVLGAKKLPNSKSIGYTTEGVFSDILRKKLPNGWTYGLSNMIYQSMDGVSYEEIGITPDYKIEYPVKSKDFYEYLFKDLEDGDDAIEMVIEKTRTIRKD
ncbi:MAG: S41 family peptidase [Maribacter sp.]